MATETNTKKNSKTTQAATRFHFPELKKRRLELGMTKEEFKAAAGVSRATIEKAESVDGFVTEASMVKLLRGLTAKGGKKFTFDDTKQKTL